MHVSKNTCICHAVGAPKVICILLLCSLYCVACTMVHAHLLVFTSSLPVEQLRITYCKLLPRLVSGMTNHGRLCACPFVHARCAVLLDFMRRVNPAHRLNAAPRASSALLSRHRAQRALRAANRSGAWVHASFPELQGIHLIRCLTATRH